MSDASAYVIDEIRRSAMDASRRTGSLLAPNGLLARYTNPSENTAYHLEYSYSLLGDVRGKSVLDYGCGAGENSLLLAARGACVTGIDISPDLVEVARRRLEINHLSAELRVVSGYETGLPDSSMDVIFCIGILHHLNLEQARREVLRVVKPGGFIIVQEPVRDSRAYAFVRSLIPYVGDEISKFERPLKKEEIEAFSEGLQCEVKRRFNLPIVALARIASQRLFHPAVRADRWILKTVPALAHLATIEVRKLRRGKSLA